jgi:hypothetical protein
MLAAHSTGPGLVDPRSPGQLTGPQLATHWKNVRWKLLDFLRETRDTWISRKALMKGKQMETVIIAFEEYELTNSCRCEDWDEETDTYSPSNSCWGCFEDDLANFEVEMLKPWMNANGYDEDTALVARGTGMTWQRLSGYAYLTPKQIVEKLAINGEWTLRFSLTDGAKTLTAVRYSHDEPTGTGKIVFEIAPDEDEDELF